MTEQEAFVSAFSASPAAETWEEEMARWERDPACLRQRKAEGEAVAEMLRERGVDLPIVLPNPFYPVGDQIGREARIREEPEYTGITG